MEPELAFGFAPVDAFFGAISTSSSFAIDTRDRAVDRLASLKRQQLCDVENEAQE